MGGDAFWLCDKVCWIFGKNALGLGVNYARKPKGSGRGGVVAMDCLLLL
jgi:hypothetical protein